MSVRTAHVLQLGDEALQVVLPHNQQRPEPGALDFREGHADGRVVHIAAAKAALRQQADDKGGTARRSRPMSC